MLAVLVVWWMLIDIVGLFWQITCYPAGSAGGGPSLAFCFDEHSLAVVSAGPVAKPQSFWLSTSTENVSTGKVLASTSSTMAAEMATP